MNQSIPAVFDAGVFRPLQPVDLADGTRVEVQVPATASRQSAVELSPEEVARRRQAIAEFISKLEALPLEGPNDGFSGRDHDKVIYQKP